MFPALFLYIASVSSVYVWHRFFCSNSRADKSDEYAPNPTFILHLQISGAARRRPPDVDAQTSRNPISAVNAFVRSRRRPTYGRRALTLFVGRLNYAPTWVAASTVRDVACVSRGPSSRPNRSPCACFTRCPLDNNRLRIRKSKINVSSKSDGQSVDNAVVTTTIRLRFDGHSTAYQRSLRSQ